jgi:XTP/dITP diphosphohydrolase
MTVTMTMTMKTTMTTPRLLLATENPKKRKELLELCAGRFDVLTLPEVGLFDLDVVEDAPDFAGNARKKAREVRAALLATGNDHGVRWILADDSGLCVDALDGHPGVRSARFAADAGYVPKDLARDGKDAANNRLLLTLLEVIPAERRGAHFHSVVSAVPVPARAGDDDLREASGSVYGRIARDLSGAGGFGYDPLFIVDDEGASALSGRRMAELEAGEKHGISHRGRAMTALLPRLD